jgi:hypothetical protein
MALGKTNFPGGNGAGLGSIYIASNNLNLGYGNVASGGIRNRYSVNVGNIIYSFSYILAGYYQLFCLYFTTDSSAFPVRIGTSTPYQGGYPNFTPLSQYIDSGIVYFNNYYSSTLVYFYDTFNLSTYAWNINNSGSHTSGTLINSALQLNGFQYEGAGMGVNNSGNVLVDMQTKVTKL